VHNKRPNPVFLVWRGIAWQAYLHKLTNRKKRLPGTEQHSVMTDVADNAGSGLTRYQLDGCGKMTLGARTTAVFHSTN